jgi:hypothetical protein
VCANKSRIDTATGFNPRHSPPPLVGWLCCLARPQPHARVFTSGSEAEEEEGGGGGGSPLKSHFLYPRVRGVGKMDTQDNTHSHTPSELQHCPVEDTTRQHTLTRRRVRLPSAQRADRKPNPYWKCNGSTRTGPIIFVGMHVHVANHP